MLRPIYLSTTRLQQLFEYSPRAHGRTERESEFEIPTENRNASNNLRHIRDKKISNTTRASMRNSTLHKELHSSAHNQAGTCVTGNTASETRLEDSQGRFAYQFWGTGPWPRTVANFMHCAAFLSKHCWRWPAQSNWLWARRAASLCCSLRLGFRFSSSPRGDYIHQVAVT